MRQSYMPQSKSDTHLTPDRVFDIIKEYWGITKDMMFDPCPVNGKDGLTIPWKKLNYVNPPYSNLPEWVDKALRELNYGNQSIMLLPTKTDQEWFHKLISYDFKILWIRKRLRFKNNKWSATQPHFLILIGDIKHG